MFQYDWQSWLSCCVIFLNKEKLQRIDRLSHMYVVFCLVILVFNQSKSNAALQTKTGHFRGLVGFKAKDLSFEAMAKNLKMCPRGFQVCLLVKKSVIDMEMCEDSQALFCIA